MNRCDHITCGRGYFCIRKEKVADSKISGYVWTGPQRWNQSILYLALALPIGSFFLLAIGYIITLLSFDWSMYKV